MPICWALGETLHKLRVVVFFAIFVNKPSPRWAVHSVDVSSLMGHILLFFWPH